MYDHGVARLAHHMDPRENVTMSAVGRENGGRVEVESQRASCNSRGTTNLQGRRVMS